MQPLTGTIPERNVVFRHSDSRIDVETALKANGYRNIPAGQKNAGEVPQRSRKGAAVETGVVVEDRAAGFPYSVPEAGTVPDRNRRGKTGGETVVVEDGAEDFTFSMPQAGTVPERNVVLRNSATQIDAETALNALGYRNYQQGRKTPEKRHRGTQRGSRQRVGP